MSTPVTAIVYVNGRRLAQALDAGIRHVFGRRDYINRINVFPVPDGDTGTNMAFTFQAILEALSQVPDGALSSVTKTVSTAALEGARGNSGAIMAQFFQGIDEIASDQQVFSPEGLARACMLGAEQSWSAMSEPVAGTLPTVLEDFARSVDASVRAGETDMGHIFLLAREAAQVSLANTPNQLPVLKQAGVVDAGGQGFVDLLDGIAAFMADGTIDALDGDLADLAAVEFDIDLEVGDHRFCTECVISGEDLDRAQVMKALNDLDSSSLVVAGNPERIRVHVHVNNPAEVFLACETFGDIARQKADDMHKQHGLLNQHGTVAVVCDSGADLPSTEAERLGIHVVPVRLSIGEREYLDGVSIQPREFYRLLDESEHFPKTSQPPPRDFKRVYSLLTSHGYPVFSVGLSGVLSGTTQAARTAAKSVDGEVRVLDTLNASCGQGLLAMVAAEAAASEMNIDEIEALLRELAPQTHTLAMPNNLESAVRGGRVPAWVKRASELTHLSPVLIAREGRLGLAGAAFGRGFRANVMTRHILKRMKADCSYRVMLAHVDNPDGALNVRRRLLERHSMIHSCHIAEAGPALGSHLGLGGVIAGFLPQPELVSR